jgi:GNAT superfamily N-acetyltransferase
MKIELITQDKKQFMDLLLIADESEDMIGKYLDRGDLFALYDDELVAVCVVTGEGDGVCELQNLAVYEKYWRQGYGAKMVGYVCDYYKDKFVKMIVATGDSRITVPFYEHCGFAVTHRIKDYMLERCPNPVIENGVQIFDMVYLTKIINEVRNCGKQRNNA